MFENKTRPARVQRFPLIEKLRLGNGKSRSRVGLWQVTRLTNSAKNSPDHQYSRHSLFLLRQFSTSRCDRPRATNFATAPFFKCLHWVGRYSNSFLALLKASMAKEGFSLGLALKQRRNATCEMQLGNRLLADMRQRCLVTNFPLWASEGINLYCPTPAKCKYLNQRRGCKVSRGRHIYIGELANQGQRLLTK